MNVPDIIAIRDFQFAPIRSKPRNALSYIRKTVIGAAHFAFPERTARSIDARNALAAGRIPGYHTSAEGARPQGGRIGKPVNSGAAPATVVECRLGIGHRTRS